MMATKRREDMKTRKEIIPICDQAICDDIRPHPGPLPQERENHSPRFEQYQYARLSYVLQPMTQNQRRQWRAKELSSDVTLLTLSPGERAGVRAGVKQNSFN